jgi:hypothetical protein
MDDWNEDNVPEQVLEQMREDYWYEQNSIFRVDGFSENHLKDLMETIAEHEEQGCNATEVASFVNLNVQQVERVKELSDVRHTS